jgi:hypothetical protein
MNYIKHLTGFFVRIAMDERLNPTHVSAYMALFQFWNINRFENPVYISRGEMMKVSKINANATYHKVINELQKFGYISYKPSYNPFKGSAVYLVNLESESDHEMNSYRTKNKSSTRQAVNGYHAKIETSSEPITEPYINNTNILNSKHCKQHKQNETDDTSSNFDGANTQEEKPVGQSFSEGRKSSTLGGAVFFEKKSRKEIPLRTTVNQQRATKTLPLPESLEAVKAFFTEQKSSSNEAEKFFNYFQSNGWKVGGRAPMKDWKAAARNWLLNADKFTSQGMRTVSFSPDKNYAEPL